MEFAVFAAGIHFNWHFAQQVTIKSATCEAAVHPPGIDARQVGTKASGKHFLSQLPRIFSPEWEDGRHSAGGEMLLTVGANVLEKEIAENNVPHAFLPRACHRLAHRLFVKFVGTWRRYRHLHQSQSSRRGLCFEQALPNGLHRHPVVRAIHRCEQRHHVEVPRLSDYVKSPGAVFAATPGEPCLFRICVAGHPNLNDTREKPKKNRNETRLATPIVRQEIACYTNERWFMTPLSRDKKGARAKRSAGRSNAWVTQTLKKMTLREKLGQMLMVPYFAVFHPSESAAYKDILREVEDNHVGGVIIMTGRGPLGLRRSQVYPTAVMLNELQRRARIPLLVSADFEAGTRMRLEEGTPFPSAMAIAATGNPKFAYDAGKYTALEARAAGIHWIFAPDADVNDNPDNPIINIRSFGEDPKSVAAYVTQSVRGVEENGALATAKHFPGHGNVNVDSHLALATVPGSREELESNELIPFRAAIKAKVSAIMPGHLAVPAFEPNPNTPATFSRHILDGAAARKIEIYWADRHRRARHGRRHVDRFSR